MSDNVNDNVKVTDDQMDEVAGGYGRTRWAVRCGNCGMTEQVCDDKLQAEGVSNSMIINGVCCRRCGWVKWYVTQI